MAFAEGRTEERDKKMMPCNAGAAISPYRICQKDSGDATEVIAATAGSQFPVGVTGDASENGKTTYAENDPIQLVYEGVAYVELGGTVAQDDRIIASTGGVGVKHTTSDGVYIFGHAMKAGVSGDIIPVLIQRYYIGDFNQS